MKKTYNYTTSNALVRGAHIPCFMDNVLVCTEVIIASQFLHVMFMSRFLHVFVSLLSMAMHTHVSTTGDAIQ